jgi:ribosomal protein S13
VFSFDQTFKALSGELTGFSKKSKMLIIKRLELTAFATEKRILSTVLSPKICRVINIYFSQITSVNAPLIELHRYLLIRLYLIKSFRGRAQALGKPCRGQRT